MTGKPSGSRLRNAFAAPALATTIMLGTAAGMALPPAPAQADDYSNLCGRARGDKDNRTIRIAGGIDTACANAVIDGLNRIASETHEEITIRINSYGGSVTDGFAMYDAMQAISNPIRTVCEGAAMSMGAFLLTMGTPGRRQAMPTCSVMQHQPNAGTGRNPISVNEVSVAESQRLKTAMRSLIGQRTGLNESFLFRLFEQDASWNVTEAKDLGMIDTIIQPAKTYEAAPERAPRLSERFCATESRRFTMPECTAGTGTSANADTGLSRGAGAATTTTGSGVAFVPSPN